MIFYAQMIKKFVGAISHFIESYETAKKVSGDQKNTGNNAQDFPCRKFVVLCSVLSAFEKMTKSKIIKQLPVEFLFYPLYSKLRLNIKTSVNRRKPVNVKQKEYIVFQEIMEAFGIDVPSNEIDIDGMVEDMCTADGASQIRMIGIYLYRAMCEDKRCSDSYNLSMFLLTLLPLPDNTAEYYKQQRLDYFNNFSVQQIRLMLFVIMNGIWEEEKLALLLEFIKKAMKFVLKII